MKKLFPVKITESEYLSHRDEYCGLCLSCAAIKFGDTEPDAEDYECDSCGKFKVTGIDNALIMGMIEIKE